MTTAHRPTFDPARGKESQRGPAYHQRLLPAYKALKHRQPGQGDTAETEVRDLRAELLRAEAVHFAKKTGNKEVSADYGDQLRIEAPSAAAAATASASASAKRGLESSSKNEVASGTADESEEDPEAKRRRLILEEAREIDADSERSDSDSSDDDDEDEDEMAELMRELEKVKRERAEQKAKEEAERAAEEAEQREANIARGNPLLNPKDFNIKRRWDDDVVFKNQARGSEEKNKRREFVNDLLRSDFHKRFMSRYVR